MCGQRVEAALQRVPGVLGVQMDWPSGRALVQHSAAIAVGELVRAVEGASAGTRHSYHARHAASDAAR